MHKKHNNALDRQEEREVLKLPADRKVTLENLESWNPYNLQKFWTRWLAYHYRLNNNDLMANQITNQEPEYLSSYYNLDLKRPVYTEEKQPNKNDDRFSKNLGYGQIFDVLDSNRDALESILDSFREKYVGFNHEMGTLHHEVGREAASMHPATVAASAVTEPEFTYKFDDSNLKEKHPFAVKPNDPRYYGETPFSSGKHMVHLF